MAINATSMCSEPEYGYAVDSCLIIANACGWVTGFFLILCIVLCTCAGINNFDCCREIALPELRRSARNTETVEYV